MKALTAPIGAKEPSHGSHMLLHGSQRAWSKEPYFNEIKDFFSKSEISLQIRWICWRPSKMRHFLRIGSKLCQFLRFYRNLPDFFSRLRLSSWNFFRNSEIKERKNRRFEQSSILFTPKSPILVRKKGKLSFFIYFFLWKKYA